MTVPITPNILKDVLPLFATTSLRIGFRKISEVDEFTLLPEEASALERSVPKRRRESGAARAVARELLTELGMPRGVIGRSASGAPIWPQGIVGSLAHDSRVAVAAVARIRDFVGLGVDIEPAEVLSADLVDLVVTPSERPMIHEDPLRGTILFAAKEAVFKATNPLDHRFLEHQDVEVDLRARRAVVRNGRTLEIRLGISHHILVLAFIRALSSKP
jgi:4'-phosphopantetheinyl transferase EntD